jgi:hypothetical protein
VIHVDVEVDEDRLGETDELEGDLKGNWNQIVEENDEGEEVVGEVLAVVCDGRNESLKLRLKKKVQEYSRISPKYQC